MFKGVTISEFQERFKTDSDCLDYLYELKWSKGFECKKCGHTESRTGNTQRDKRCLKCGYEESVTAQTLFHKIKFQYILPSTSVTAYALPKRGCRRWNYPES